MQLKKAASRKGLTGCLSQGSDPLKTQGSIFSCLSVCVNLISCFTLNRDSVMQLVIEMVARNGVEKLQAYIVCSCGHRARLNELHIGAQLAEKKKEFLCDYCGRHCDISLNVTRNKYW